MSRLQTFQVFPCIPEPLSFIEELSRNMWWSWQYDARELFRRIDPRLWKGAARRNAVLFLTLVDPRRFEELAKDNSFLAYQRRVQEHFQSMVCIPREQFATTLGPEGKIVYFSMEFGIHESLPLYAGGLGILAGDHLKAASDRVLPMAAVGLLYRQGYFSQFLNQEGTQQEEYPETDFFHLPIGRAKDPLDKELYVSIAGPDGEIQAAVWKAQVGCVPLFLLDTNLPENSPDIRNITSTLYAGDARTRLAQEMLLGIGGMRALLAMGINPAVCHMNEGHCAFAGLERLAHVVSTYHVDLKTAWEIVSRTNVFTTHTPVMAGHDEFPADMVRPYLEPLQTRLGVSKDEILSWGQAAGSGPNGPLSMFVLGLRLSQDRNGVSRLHGQVARRMWAHVWPGVPEDEVPISHITNGVHVPSWISYELALLFERYLGSDWDKHAENHDISKRIDEIYAEELWLAHEMNRTRLIRFCRERMLQQYGRRNAPKAMMEDAESVLDQDILTIGFARRFATYKRSYLLLMDTDRLEALITSKTRPIQFVFAGKAHPKDQEGKDLIKLLIHFGRKASVRHRFIFLEDYDPNIARHLIQGADVWLNTPRRPYEACGTSGMKAALNGVLNVSVLDGWWCEGYSEDCGWKIGNGEEHSDIAYQDAVESQALYNILENDVIPCFYERKNGDVPLRWMKMMKASMKMAIEKFCSHKMVDEYARRFYQPAAERFQTLIQNEAAEAKRLRDCRERLKTHWGKIKVHLPAKESEGPFRVGETLKVTAAVHLGELRPDEVDVELYYGHLKSLGLLKDGATEPMFMTEERGNGDYLYSGVVTCNSSGRFGFTARITPQGDDLTKFSPGLITWA
ncbi:MAG: alpha-glucan family phosphorylase [Desulfobacterales bacterium]|nr:alpha-glucan family phosphorylase [Desulfobacterales bacterium]